MRFDLAVHYLVGETDCMEILAEFPNVDVQTTDCNSTYVAKRDGVVVATMRIYEDRPTEFCEDEIIIGGLLSDELRDAAARRTGTREEFCDWHLRGDSSYKLPMNPLNIGEYRGVAPGPQIRGARMTVEQMVRDLLQVAISDGLVRARIHKLEGRMVHVDPQEYGDGQLVEVANLLSTMIDEVLAHRLTEWPCKSPKLQS